MAEARPDISGPVAGGVRGWGFGMPDAAEIAARGYVMEEFFIAGEAQAYRPIGALSDDGLWRTEPDGRAAYKTRLYVVRPADPARFNGIVLVNWQNVTAGVDLGWPQDEENFRGYAWVGVTAQKIGVDGRPGITKGLAAWDSERYGGLFHPGDAYAYDIFTQAARLVGKNRPALSPDPLGGLKPKMIIAMGGSQSAMRLGSYINIAHQRDRVFDAFLLTVHWGICPMLPEVSLTKQMRALGDGRWAHTSKINDTSGTPILALCSESEAFHNYPARQPDTDTFRFWEMAGSSHSGPEMGDGMAALFARDGLARGPQLATRNTVKWGYVREAALRRLIEWARDGKAPPILPPIAMEGGAKAKILRDRFGNALGGIRLPEVEAPIAMHRGDNEHDPMTALQGQSIPFTAAQLRELYPKPQIYAEAWNNAVDALARRGLVLPESEPALRARGEEIAASLVSGGPARQA